MEERVGPFLVTDRKLGEGGQVSDVGEGVFLGTDTRNGQQVAVKKFFFRRIVAVDDAAERTSKYTRLKREVQNQWKLSRGHPNIVTLRDVLFDDRHEFLCLVMELGDGKDLFEQVLARGRVAEPEAARWFRQVLQGVSFVHSMGICHRDLKLENVLLHSDGTVKLADFGMSKDFSQSIVDTRTHIGTLAYLAPELFEGEEGGAGGYSPEPVDVWALGVMLYVMTVGDYPFGTDMVVRGGRWVQDGRARQQCVGNILAGRFNEASGFQHLSAPLQDLLRKLLTVSPAQRITADVIAAHPWLEQAPPPPTYVGMAGAGAGVGGGTTAAGAAGAAAAGVVAAAGGSTPGVEEEEEEPEASRDWSAFWPDAESLTGGGGGGGGGMSLPTSFSFGSDDSIDSMGSPAVMQMASGSFDLQSNLDLLPGLASLDSGGGLPLQLSAGGGMDEGD